MNIRKTLIQITVFLLTWNMAEAAYGANYEVQTDLLGRKQIYSEGKLIVTMKKNDVGSELFFNADREQIGAAVKNEDGVTEYFNADGRQVGYARNSADGSVNYYESTGKYLGNSRDNALSNGIMFYDVVIQSSSGAADSAHEGDVKTGGRNVAHFVKTFSI
ncbi:MAG: hypothetical protein J6I35_03935 [Ruminobacter sp.]|uniref:hypothetical protein n=1 Tax=Ruminobacter sp. TaxID=2774296 RepID=UPI001AFE7224|nr:hypothetical protein [Ruminobacter sp.]MBO6009822.1 hypothetical protein [Ruminobacter sp.]MBP3748688.1 hypothetical protein [Ruminobacter sp.]